MPPISTEENIRFLLSCTRFGKIDFNEVAKECGIISRGAAAKRYERMMKAHDLSPKDAPVRRAAKKRKADEAFAADDDEEILSRAPDTMAKNEIKGEKKEITAKQEYLMSDNTSHLPFYKASSQLNSRGEKAGSEHSGVSGYATPAGGMSPQFRGASSSGMGNAYTHSGRAVQGPGSESNFELHSDEQGSPESPVVLE